MIRGVGLSDIFFIVQGAGWTLVLTAIAFIGGSLIGLPMAILRTSKSLPLRIISSGYMQFIQGIPVLMLLFIFYFGLSVLGFRLPTLVAVGIGLMLYSSAFLADIWRGAIQSIAKTQWEAAEALALSPAQRMTHVIIPQAIRRAIPPTVGFLVQIIKNSSIASIVGYVELSRAGQMISDATFQPLLVFSVVAVIYFLIGFPISALSRTLERKLHGAR